MRLSYLKNFLPYKNPAKFFIFSLTIILFSVEILTYYFATFSWHSIKCTLRSNCIKILLVADPQLLGYYNDRNRFLSSVAMWDSDRYLSRTYMNALYFTQPDIILFLGDLFDEGSTANDEEFKSYLKRLHILFTNRSHVGTLINVKQFWIPGDNDIGGEGFDPITKHKVERFNKYFKQPPLVELNGFKFCSINRFLGTFGKISNSNDDVGTIIGLSHVPLITKPSTFVESMLEQLKPQVLFTAHEHSAMISSINKDYYLGSSIIMSNIKSNKVYKYKLGLDKIYEIQVPTCSYRMGTSNIGYGYAVIENNNLQYTVLWTPSRFKQLIFYTVFIGVGSSFVFMSYYIKYKNNKMKYTLLNNI